MQAIVILAIGSGAEPLVPVQALGNRLAGRDAAAAAEIAGEDAVRLDDIADGPAPDELDQAAIALAAMALVAHLREDLVLLGGLGQGAALVDVVGQRLLAEGVLAAA